MKRSEREALKRAILRDIDRKIRESPNRISDCQRKRKGER